MDFKNIPDTNQSFENALEKAKNRERLSIEDGVELLTTGTDKKGIDKERKKEIIKLADKIRKEKVGEEVTFVANLNNNVTTACNTGCLFCNFKDPAIKFEKNEGKNSGFTKTPDESRKIVKKSLKRGIYEVCSVSGLHPTLALNKEHREILEKQNGPNYNPPENYEKNPGNYTEQIKAMDIDGIHVHSMTPEEAKHAKRGTDWTYKDIYSKLKKGGLDSVPGTAAEILVDEVRDIICPGKLYTDEWMEAMEGVAKADLPMTSTIMYGHVENEMHRIMHLEKIRELQDKTNNITEFVPLKFVYPDTPLYERGMVEESSTKDEDELLIAVSRLFLDNINNIQTSWVKYGDDFSLKLLECGANDYMGTLLSEEITKRAGGEYGEFRSFEWYVEKIISIDRIPVERSTDYEKKRTIDPNDTQFGPKLGPYADGTPILSSKESKNLKKHKKELQT